jgi:hypothetical protein
MERFGQASTRNPRVRAEILAFIERSYARLSARSASAPIAAMPIG